MSETPKLLTHCHNCDTPLQGHFCHHCGQQAELEAPTVREFIHEYLHHYVALEGKLWQTLKLLLKRPGELTLEFMRGRRQRFVKPLALYLTFSFLWFLLNSFAPNPVERMQVELDMKIAQGQQIVLKRETKPELNPPFEPSEDAWFADRARDALAVVKTVQSKTPYVVFALLPVYSFWLWLFYRKRKPLAGTHLVFAVHYHAFFFMLLLPVTIIEILNGELPKQAGLVPILWWGYLALALRRVYGDGRFSAWWRALCLMVLHGSLVLLTLLGITIGITVYNAPPNMPTVPIQQPAKLP